MRMMIFFKRGQLLTKTLMLQGYNKSSLKSSFRKFYGRYNDLVCDSKLSLSRILTDLVHTFCLTVIFVLDLTTGNPVYIVSTIDPRRV